MSDSLSPGRSSLSFDPNLAFPLPRRLPGNVRSQRARAIGLACKRVFDILGAAILLLILLPVLPVLALAVRMDGGPVLYRHTRVGLDGRAFGCLKYRTMVPSADRVLADYLAANPLAAAEWTAARKLSHDPRVTRLGAIMRSTSLDEVPQLFNVLRGEMSLVGPRPVVRDELEEHYGPAGRDAYAATKPGITGLWQVSGRSGTSYEQRVSLDITYARTWSLLLDLKILFRTVPAVLARRGAV
jgi:undecaprenyl-phosphate galactose phosphotransferase